MILELYVDDGVDPATITTRLAGAPYSLLIRQTLAGGICELAGVVTQVTGLVDRAEYKRRQMAPGLKITPRAFGRDRQLPITNGWVGR